MSRTSWRLVQVYRLNHSATVPCFGDGGGNDYFRNSGIFRTSVLKVDTLVLSTKSPQFSEP